MHIGKLKHKINVSSEFLALAKADEAAADSLFEEKHFRQACYFMIQSMEKIIRAKIFTLVNPNLEYFRSRNRSHSLESAVEFLIEIVSTDKIIQEQISKQLNFHVLGNTRYEHLHNNLRYPSYSNKYNAYSVLEVGPEDFGTLKLRLESLKRFLNDLHKFS